VVKSATWKMAMRNYGVLDNDTVLRLVKFETTWSVFFLAWLAALQCHALTMVSLCLDRPHIHTHHSQCVHTHEAVFSVRVRASDAIFFSSAVLFSATIYCTACPRCSDAVQYDDVFKPRSYIPWFKQTAV